MKKIKIGINGFGRIGRTLLRLGENLKVVAINSKAPVETAAHLLKYDTIHGTYSDSISTTKNHIQIRNQNIPYISYQHPKDIPWNKWHVDWVLECSGKFKDIKDIKQHFKKGVKKVFTAYPSSADFTLIYGVNHSLYNDRSHHIISNSSCTTNCLSPIIQLLHKKFHIRQLSFTTIHSYTSDQKLLDATHKDLRRARAANLSIIPTTTGATQSLEKIFPDLKGHLQGVAIRVPTANVSLVDLVFWSKKSLSLSDIHQAFLSAEKNNLKNILRCEHKELVSVDFNNNSHSCVVDMPSVQVTSDNMARVLGWYDNETGFAQRMIDFILMVEKSK